MLLTLALSHSSCRLFGSTFCLCIVLCAIPSLAWFSSSYYSPFSSRMPTHVSMSSETSGDTPSKVVIAGAGVVGTSTAYYLWENHGIASTLVDPTGRIAPAASGKAGGFLALDWNEMSPVGPLARRSFELHQQLADTFGADTLQYRHLTCAAVSVDASKSKQPSGKKLGGVEWAQDAEDDNTVLGVRNLGDESTIAQVHPKLLCDTLWSAASKAPGADLVQGKLVSPVFDDGVLVGAKLEDGTVLAAEAILFACGPWATNVMNGVKYHSVVIPTPRVLNQSVFFDGYGDPEVYPRPDSTAYCTGFPDPPIVVEESPGEEEVRSEAIARIVKAVRAASGGTSEGAALASAQVIEQACYLPTSPDGLPVMGPVPPESVGGNGCYVAAGHSCWGILLGPASGESMARLIATGATDSVSLRPFDPARFPRFKLDRLLKPRG